VPQLLLLADAETSRDVLTFVGRASRITDEGVRLQAADGVLAMTTAALSPQGLFDQTPTILAMRIVRADPELACDIVVAELSAGEDEASVTLPETGLSPAWAGVAPPRGGWEPLTSLPASTIANRAQWGISAVARGATPGASRTTISPSCRAASRSPPMLSDSSRAKNRSP
jgi:hypothetical protein